MFDFLPDQILGFLQWLFPYGLGGAITWLISGRIRKARVEKELFESYKSISDQQQEKIELLSERLGNAVEKMSDMQIKMARLESEKAMLEEVMQSYKYCKNASNCRVAQTYLRYNSPLSRKPKGRHRPRDIDMDATEEGSTLSDHPP